jgi:hypothetical protein
LGRNCGQELLPILPQILPQLIKACGDSDYPGTALA